jgi:uncharacterized protein (TIGR00369 family)
MKRITAYSDSLKNDFFKIFLIIFNMSISENEIRASFEKQTLMATLNAKMIEVTAGKVTIECLWDERLSQQHGLFHAGVLTSIVDTACGYAAWSLMPEGKDVLTVEFKINFLKPAKTPKLIALGSVIQSGKTLTVCEGFVYDETRTKLLAKMSATMMAVMKSGI